MKKLRSAIAVMLASILLVPGSSVFAATESFPEEETYSQKLYDILETPESFETVGATNGYQAGNVKVSILGDSVSTYMGYTDYSEGGNYYGKSNDPIMPVEDTWWMSLLMDNQWSLDVNESLGGSRVTWDGKTQDNAYHTGSDFYMASDARINKLGANGAPDKIFIFGGLNDILSQGEVKIGSYSPNLTYGKVDTFADAYYTMVKKIETKYPNAEIVCIIPYDTIWGSMIQTIADAQKQVPDVIKGICKQEGLKYVDLRDADIDASTDTIQSDLIHPNASGMAKIKTHIEKSLAPHHGIWKDGGKYYYYDENSQMVKNKMMEVDGYTYFFQADGSAMANTRTFDPSGKYWIYFGEDGRMVKDTLVKDEKSGNSWYFDKEGHQVFGNYVKTNGTAYYFDESGNMYTKDSYVDKNGDIRFFKKNGEMIFNDYHCDGKYTYYLQNDGTAMKNRLTYHPNGREIIYFDENGHEAFDQFVNVKTSISGEKVNDICYFNTFGYMYVDKTTYNKEGTSLYYLNPYGVMQQNGWFQFADGNIGFANGDGTLMTSQFSYDQWNRMVYFQADGTLARGVINDGTTYYLMDENDGHLIGTFQ